MTSELAWDEWLEDSGKNGYGYTWWTSEHSHNGNEIKMSLSEKKIVFTSELNY